MHPALHAAVGESSEYTLYALTSKTKNGQIDDQTPDHCYCFLLSAANVTRQQYEIKDLSTLSLLTSTFHLYTIDYHLS